jgi:hypothetical protein
LENISVIELIAIIRKLLTSGLERDAEERTAIENLTDEEVLQRARETCIRVDEKATTFIKRLDNEPGE